MTVKGDTGAQVRLNAEELHARLRNDPEFALTTRYLTARFQIRVGARVLNLRFVDGDLLLLAEGDTGFTSYDVLVAADTEVWAEMLSEIPRPFYQDLWSAKFYHGLRIEGDTDLMSAYYPSLSRLRAIMRELQAQEETA